MTTNTNRFYVHMFCDSNELTGKFAALCAWPLDPTEHPPLGAVDLGWFPDRGSAFATALQANDQLKGMFRDNFGVIHPIRIHV